MKKPIIGISGSTLIDQDGIFPGYHHSYVNEDYVISVQKNGGIPLIIPFNTDHEVIKEQVEQIDGLILSGGHDVTPINYHEEPLEKLQETSPQRDDFDFTLIKEAMTRKLPILGICRGIQIINTYFGGSLYQDLSYRKELTYRHMQKYSPTEVTHHIEVQQQSQLHDILGKNSLIVNSFHHQILKDLAPNFKAVAHAKDGVIEAIESKDYPYLLGIQWHPEMLHESQPVMNQQVFGSLIKEATKKGI
ncbi:gamma-glutamyl-gamma-aminobutyrate hydrolase family protein [Xylocopilactobacillus apis]|uniref:Gamma-glutamyl-gamma-aminobutyrate hydrolase n=1 Tax=Xylocopilactobacillus apis TaxID=2932183 RepID=A0AAU9CPU6_9LACO|nr:gamma-glutamyl-gamma-aminobutyrate hydrolase family protein [Xylocopilactobacillus apis]BDR55972.1 gamma-glutamyl-gamma-aminobutyrate hydrolase [Xylocopilactobacillus apis]